MRVFFAGAPGSGLYLPTLPLAWAFRAAGHEVLVANTGAASQVVARSGFATVDACPGRDVQAEFLSVGKAILATPAGQPKPRGGMGLFGEAMADGLLSQARAFGPDLVVSTLEQGAAPLIAAELEVPLVEQSVRLAWAGSDAQAVSYRQAVAEFLEPTRQRLGLPPGATALAVLDCRPKSLGGLDDRQHWPMRYIPYNEGRVLPAEVRFAGDRPRICVTMGSVLPAVADNPDAAAWLASALHRLLSALAELDAEVVLAMAESEAAGLESLPDNVVVAGWTPLNALLPDCSLIVHHGGAGTSFTALTAGLPQLALPRGADQPANAAVLAEGGVAEVHPMWTAEPGWVRDTAAALLRDADRRQTARAVQAEIEAMPSPAAAVERIVARI